MQGNVAKNIAFVRVYFQNNILLICVEKRTLSRKKQTAESKVLCRRVLKNRPGQ